MLLTGCEYYNPAESGFCCFSPLVAIPFLLLAVFQMRKDWLYFEEFHNFII